jgi:hypothetical protein
MGMSSEFKILKGYKSNELVLLPHKTKPKGKTTMYDTDECVLKASIWRK